MFLFAAELLFVDQQTEVVRLVSIFDGKGELGELARKRE